MAARRIRQSRLKLFLSHSICWRQILFRTFSRHRGEPYKHLKPFSHMLPGIAGTIFQTTVPFGCLNPLLAWRFGLARAFCGAALFILSQLLSIWVSSASMRLSRLSKAVFVLWIASPLWSCAACVTPSAAVLSLDGAAWHGGMIPSMPINTNTIHGSSVFTIDFRF